MSLVASASFVAVAAIMAPSLDLIRCESSPFITTKCVIQDYALADPIDFNGPVETTFELRFLFDCKGHRSNFGFAGKKNGLISGFQRVQSSSDMQTIEITSDGTLLAFDPEPAKTFASSFWPRCEFSFFGATSRPSLHTMSLWRLTYRQLLDRFEHLSLIIELLRQVVHDESISKANFSSIAASLAASAEYYKDLVAKGGGAVEKSAYADFSTLSEVVAEMRAYNALLQHSSDLEKLYTNALEATRLQLSQYKERLSTSTIPKDV